MWSSCSKYCYLCALCAVFTSRYWCLWPLIYNVREGEKERARWINRERSSEIDPTSGENISRTVVSFIASLKHFHHIWYVSVCGHMISVQTVLYVCVCEFLDFQGKPRPMNVSHLYCVILTTFQWAYARNNCANDDNSQTTGWNH